MKRAISLMMFLFFAATAAGCGSSAAPPANVPTGADEPKQLAIGREAPEIEGNDVDGVPFKLSDYRGKVVVLDFWGDW